MERCFRCRQYHSRTYGTPQVCFQCGQTRHVKRFYPMINGTDSVGQSYAQPRAPIQGFGRSAVRPSVFSRSEAGSSGTQRVQRPQRAQTCIFAMTSAEAQANPYTVTGIMLVFDTPARVLFDTGSSRSFINTTFVLHANRELVPLKNKLIVNTPLGEQILRTSVFKGCEIVVGWIVLKANLIPLEMSDLDVILRMDRLSNHRASMDCFTKKIVFKKPGYLKLEIEGDRRILPTCVISALEAKRLLHKGCEMYLAHVIDKSSFKVTVENVPVVCEFPDVFLEDLPGLPPDREFEIELLPSSAYVSIS